MIWYRAGRNLGGKDENSEKTTHAKWFFPKGRKLLETGTRKRRAESLSVQ